MPETITIDPNHPNAHHYQFYIDTSDYKEEVDWEVIKAEIITLYARHAPIQPLPCGNSAVPQEPSESTVKDLKKVLEAVDMKTDVPCPCGNPNHWLVRIKTK